MREASLAIHRKSVGLKKHVGLIHSANSLSLLERKIANALLYNAYDDLLNQEEHSVHIPLLCKLIGYNSKDYKTIKRSLTALISTVLEWNLIDKEKKESEGVWVASSMLADAKIDGAICTYSYSRRMRELCYHPEFYGRLSIEVLSKFKSTYGLALYENCIRYKNINQTPWFDLSIFRKLMGVENGKYEIFRDLNRRVIKPAVSEVNSHSSIRVFPEFKKQGRVVTAIKFLIKKTSNNELVLDKGNNTVSRLSDDYGFPVKKAIELLAMYDEKYILEKIQLIESSNSYLSGKIDNLSKYLEKALQDDYQAPKSSKTKAEEMRQKREHAAVEKKVQENKMIEYRKYQNSELLKLFERLGDCQKIEIKNVLYNFIQSTLYDKIYVLEGLKNPIIGDKFGDFIREKHATLLGRITSFDQFCGRG